MIRKVCKVVIISLVMVMSIGTAISLANVNLRSGALSFQETDIQIPYGDLSIALRRTFSAPAAQRVDARWTFNLIDSRVEVDAAKKEYIWAHDGLRLAFQDVYEGVPQKCYVPGCSYLIMVKKSTGYEVEDTHGGLIYFYDQQGRIIRQEDSKRLFILYKYNTRNQLDYIEDRYGRRITLTCDGSGRLVQALDPTGRVFSYAYNSSGQLISVTNPLNVSKAYQYNSSGQMTSLTDYNNHQIKFEYNREGRVSKMLFANGDFQLFSYVDSGSSLVTQKKDSINRTYTYTFQKFGNTLLLVKMENPQGGVYIAEYDLAGKAGMTNGNIVKVVDPLGGVHRFRYDENNNLIWAKDGVGNEQQWTYDQRNCLVEEIDAEGNSSRYRYDAGGQRLLLKKLEPLAKTTSYEYDSLGRKIKETDPAGRVKEYIYDNYGYLKTEKDAFGNLTTYTHDQRGNLLSLTKSNGAVWLKSWDAMDRLISETDPAGSLIRNTYDHHGNLLSITDRNGHRTSYTYDAKNRITSITNHLGHTETYAYTTEGCSTCDVGDITKVVNSLGKVTRFEYNGLLLMTKMINSLGQATTFTYDVIGNRTSLTNPDGQTTHYEYDAMGRVIKVKDPLNRLAQYKYDGRGNKINLVDAAGQVTINSYDALNRLIQAENPLGEITRYEYSKTGQVTKIINPLGQATKFSYDLADRLLGVEDPLGNTTSYAYDSVGNLIQKTDANGRTTHYQYNSLGLQVKILYPNSHNLPDPNKVDLVVTLAYDDSGNLLRGTNGAADMEYEYDALDRLIKVKNKTLAKTMVYTYDVGGNRLTMVDPEGETVYYTYDDLNRLISVAHSNNTDKSTFTYNADGQLLQKILPSGVKTIYQYDAAGQMISVMNKKPDDSLISGFTYTYNALGLRTKLEQTTGGTIEYQYDSIYRLTSELKKSGSTTIYNYQYAYDAAGNRSRLNADGVETLYTYNAGNQLTQEQTGSQIISYQYDHNGNLIKKTVPGGDEYLFEYDAEDRLSFFDAPGSTSDTSYLYDHDSKRIEATVNGSVARYVYDRANLYYEKFKDFYSAYLMRKWMYGTNVIAEYDETSLTASYMMGLNIDQPLVKEISGQSYNYLQDGLGSVRQIIDQAGDNKNQYDYDAFGRILTESENIENAYKFASRRWDEQSQMYYYRNRYYDPKIGRFTQKDPLASGVYTSPLMREEMSPLFSQILEPNAYGYPSSNPVNIADPQGTISILGIVCSGPLPVCSLALFCSGQVIIGACSASVFACSGQLGTVAACSATLVGVCSGQAGWIGAGACSAVGAGACSGQAGAVGGSVCSAVGAGACSAQAGGQIGECSATGAGACSAQGGAGPGIHTGCSAVGAGACSASGSILDPTGTTQCSAVHSGSCSASTSGTCSTQASNCDVDTTLSKWEFQPSRFEPPRILAGLSVEQSSGNKVQIRLTPVGYTKGTFTVLRSLGKSEKWVKAVSGKITGDCVHEAFDHLSGSSGQTVSYKFMLKDKYGHQDIFGPVALQIHQDKWPSRIQTGKAKPQNSWWTKMMDFFVPEAQAQK